MTEHEADCMLEPLLTDAIAVIESCAGFTDETTPVGEAWAIVLRHLQTDNRVSHEKTKLSEACEAISRLADMIPSGHLLAATDPVGFLDAVTAELKDLRAEVARIANEKVTQDTPMTEHEPETENFGAFFMSPQVPCSPCKCPVCDGTGLVSRPPWIAVDQQTWTSTSTGPWPCKACGGTGIVYASRQ